MIEKLLVPAIAKLIELGVSYLVARDKEECSMVGIQKTLAVRQANDALAKFMRHHSSYMRHKKHIHITINMMGPLSESEQITVMRYVQRYLAINYDPMVFKKLQICWRMHNSQVSTKKPSYTRLLPYQPWRTLKDE